MDQLRNFGVNPGLPKAEFVSLLKLHSSEELNSIRTTLFMEANTLNLIYPELQGLPLVNRQDTALRPASTVLSEDIWCIMNCISNNVTVPRILIKNGKKSKTFLKNAPPVTPKTHPYPFYNPVNPLSIVPHFKLKIYLFACKLSTLLILHTPIIKQMIVINQPYLEISLMIHLLKSRLLYPLVCPSQTWLFLER